MTDARTASEVAWGRLLDDLRAAGETVIGPLGATTDRERAEGFRHLLRLLSLAGEQYLEKGDTARPQFTRWANPHRKAYGDNPQTHYDAANIDPALTYRLRGNRGTCGYLGICIYATSDDGSRSIVGNLDDTDLRIAADGSFEVVLSATRPDNAGDVDWLGLSSQTTDVMVRQYFIDRDQEVDATYTLTAEPDAGIAPPLDEATLVARLAQVGAWVTETIEVESTLSALMAMATPGLLRAGDQYVEGDGSHAAPPIDPAVVQKAMPTPAIQYTGSWFDDLGDDEALVVSGVAPTCRYWSIQLLTRWMESGDWTSHACFLTGRTIKVDADGRFRVVVAHRNPGGVDWLDTTGLRSASVAMRALGSAELLDVTFTREKLPQA